jgi:hypothetical protein
MSTVTVNRWTTPPKVACELGVDVHAILAWIKAGELRAVNLAANANGKRPRWKISPSDLEAFLARRASQAPTTPVRRRRKQEGVIKFF